jgi:hypothetical protein
MKEKEKKDPLEAQMEDLIKTKSDENIALKNLLKRLNHDAEGEDQETEHEEKD